MLDTATSPIAFNRFNWRIWMIEAIGIIISVSLFHLRERYPFDDTYITFRYAQHLAHGQGLVWNIGGPHTEGYTNFLYVLLLALLEVLHIDLLIGAQIIGLICVIVSGICLVRLCKHIDSTLPDWFCVLAALMFFATPLIWINALSGMETALFLALTVLALNQFYRWRTTRSGAAIYFAFILATLCTLTRPEGILLGIFFTLDIIIHRKTLLDHRPVFRAVFFAFVLPLSIYIAWKWSYFGYPLPNSFYVKVLGSNRSHGGLFHGLQYVRLFAVSVFILLPGVLLYIRHEWKDGSLLCAWIFCLLLFYSLVLPLEGMYDRFLIPAIPAIYIIGLAGWYRISRGKSILLQVSLTCGIGIVSIFLLLLSPRTTEGMRSHEEILNNWTFSIARILKSIPNYSTISFASGDAGITPFVTGMEHVDLVGLNTTAIAHSHSELYAKQVILQEHPDIILLPAKKQDSCWHLVEVAFGVIGEHTEVVSYEPVAILPNFPSSFICFVNLRSPHFEDISKTLTVEARQSPDHVRPWQGCLDQ